jgi:2'-5' RNA ligase
MRLNFFFLLVSPPEEIMEYVSSKKKFVKELIGHGYESFHSKAHLTLHQYFDFHNESLLYTFSERVSQIKSFTIHLADFRIFPNNGTIYLNAFALELDELAKKLRRNRSFTPHITIAKKLNPQDLNLAWQAFKNLPYKNSFRCGCVTVLKRTDDRWRPHIDLPLG